MDKEFMIRVMKANWRALEHIGEEMKLDREIIGVATGVNAEALQGGSDKKIRTMVSFRTG